MCERALLYSLIDASTPIVAPGTAAGVGGEVLVAVCFVFFCVSPLPCGVWRCADSLCCSFYRFIPLRLVSPADPPLSPHPIRSPPGPSFPSSAYQLAESTVLGPRLPTLSPSLMLFLSLSASSHDAALYRHWLGQRFSFSLVHVFHISCFVPRLGRAALCSECCEELAATHSGERQGAPRAVKADG